MSIPPARRRSKASTAIIWSPALRARGHRQVIPLTGPGELAGIVQDLAKPGDYVVCLGAGNITQWAYALPGELQALEVTLRATEAAASYSLE